jgi:hypothetical protein
VVESAQQSSEADAPAQHCEKTRATRHETLVNRSIRSAARRIVVEATSSFNWTCTHIAAGMSLQDDLVQKPLEVALAARPFALQLPESYFLAVTA